MERKHYSGRYSHLLSPLVLPNGVMLKNRIVSTSSQNNFVQGGLFPYPTADMITYYATRAKNGAAAITITGLADKYYKAYYEDYANPEVKFKSMKNKGYPEMPYGHKKTKLRTYYEIENKDTHCMWTKLTEEVHMHQTLVLGCSMPVFPSGYDVSGGESRDHYFAGSLPMEEMSAEKLREMQDYFVDYIGNLKLVGFDGIELFMACEMTIPARLLSKKLNERTDEYGGSLENRARWLIEFLTKIKERYGKKFVIELGFDNGDPNNDGLEERIQVINMLEGLVDYVSIRDFYADPSQPSTYEPWDHYPIRHTAAKIKAACPNIPISALGGFCNPDDMERFLKEGLFDMYDVARAFIANPEYGKCLIEGRGEDVIPCLRCNKCHGQSILTSEVILRTKCSVNPEWGLENRAHLLSDVPTYEKSVGIIGGGPAGMRAALYAADRGHNVTIYEKASALGGLIRSVDGYDYKWVLTSYKEWLIRQVSKHPNITVKLNTTADKNRMIANGHDAVIAAIGGSPIVPPIPGIEYAKDCYHFMLNKEEAGKNVVIIGGGEVGIDCGIELAHKGHNVTVLEAKGVLAASAVIMHSYSHVVNCMKSFPNFHGITMAKATNITDGCVEYADSEGNIHAIEADTILYAVGLHDRIQDAVACSDGAHYEFYAIGDCKNPSSLYEHNRDAFGAGILV